LLAIGPARAVVHSEDCVSHFYGSTLRPHLEIRIEEGDGGPAYLSVDVMANNGVATRATSQMARPANDRKSKAGIELAGTTRLHGREFLYRANLSHDRSTLEVLEPKSVLLVDGTKLVHRQRNTWHTKCCS
jgi:hypothetical protein